ncbi:MAG: DUF427 domain-containing protein [Hyphomicrobiaceae bacterium]
MPADAIDRSVITQSTKTIHNPDEPRHFMRLKPAGKRIRILREGRELAVSDRALRLLEVGKDVYDPVLYIPPEDVRADLLVRDKRTFCPLKGHASYFDLAAADGRAPVPEIAWSYRDTLPFAREIDGLVAFYGDKVTIEESPSGS